MDLVTDLLAAAFLLAGAAFSIIAGIGILRLPDVFTRSHSAGVLDTLGVAFTLIGLMFYAGLSLITAKLMLIWLFIWFTSPIAGHSLSRAALTGGLRPVLGKNLSRAEAEGSVLPVISGSGEPST